MDITVIDNVSVNRSNHLSGQLGIHISMHVIYDSGIPLLGIFLPPYHTPSQHPTNSLYRIEDLYKDCIAALLERVIMASTSQKKNGCLSTQEWLYKLWFMDAIKFYAADKKKGIVQYVHIRRIT